MNWAEKREKGVALCSENQGSSVNASHCSGTCWSADGRMTTNCLKSEANIIEASFFFFAGMRTIQGVMRLRKNKVKVHGKYHSLSRLWC